MIESLYVHLKMPDGKTVLVGQAIRGGGAGRTGVGKFRYAPSYLVNPAAFPLDPINLPLDDALKEFLYDSEKPGLPGVLLDAGPDSWGKKWMALFRDPPPTTDVDFLLNGSGTGIGALRFTRSPNPPPPDTPIRPFASLNDILTVAIAIQKNDDSTFETAAGQHLKSFFDRGSSIGGARPKTLIEHEGDEWLAKFPRAIDAFDNPKAEHLTMQMAKAAGIETAETKILNTPQGTVLLVKRFDIQDQQQSHFISLISLINVFAIRDRDEEVFSYQNLARLANQICRESTSEEVFARMVFNIAVGNTDDHMRNHGMLKRPDETQYRLTPAYDIVPNPGMVGSHSISIGPMGSTPTKDNIMGAAQRMGISAKSAVSIVSRVLTATADWKQTFHNAGFTDKELSILSKSFDYGRRSLASIAPELTQLASTKSTLLDDVVLEDLPSTESTIGIAPVSR